MTITSLGHLVLTVSDLDRTCRFYGDILGMDVTTFGDNRKALRFGDQKINLHVAGREFEPKAHTPLPGSADLCFLCAMPLEQVRAELERHGVPIVEGIVLRTGALGPIRSLYIRDPDNNLIELSNPVG